MKGHTFILFCALAITKGDRAINGHHDPSKASEICAVDESNGVLVAHENCNQFYICNAGVPVAFKCYGNLNYNTNGEFCDWPINVDCGDRTIYEEENGDDQDNSAAVNDDPNQAAAICAAKDSEGIMIAHENCNQYYKCSEGLPVAYYCQGHLFYDPSKQYCDCVGFVVCGERHVPESDEEDDGSDGNENEESGNGSCNCNPGEAPKICASGNSEGVLVAHEKCNNFYKCSEGTPVPIKCPGNLLFNPKAKICDWPENVECGDRTIPEGDNENTESDGSGDNGESGNDNDSGDNGSIDNENGDNSDSGNGSCNCNPGEAPTICASEGSEGVLVAHEKCNKFYKCVHGKPFPIKCPINLLYNPVEEICDWSENVKCGDRVIPDPNDNENSGDIDSEDVGTGDNDNSDNDGTDNDNGNGAGNCNPSEAPKICAANDSAGILVAHEKCNKFYQCNQGKPTPIKCPGSLLFNPAKDACDWPENVKCGDRIIPEGDSNDEGDGDVGNGDNGNDNDSNDNGNEDNDNVNGSCNCNPGEAPIICASVNSDGVLVAHEKCNKFYTCSLGKPVTIRCPSGLLYNPWDQVCDWPENVKCGDRYIPDSNDSEDSDSIDVGTGDNDGTDNDNGSGNCDPSEAPKICAANESDGILVAHEKCNEFYMCIQGKPIPIKCPGSLLFNPAKDACDWPENVKCGDRIIPEGDSDDNDNGDVGNGNNGNDNDSNDYGNGDNDNGNGSCNCNPGEAPKICASDDSEGVLVAHEKCNKFYTCSEGKPVTIRCPGGLLYNPWDQVCDWPENVKCGDRVIPEKGSEENDNDDVGTGDNGNDNGSDNGNNIDCHDDPSQAPIICAATGSEGVLIAHENCNQFYICSEGKPSVLSCQNNLLYNPKIQACDWPQNVNCGDRVIPEKDREDDADDNDNDNESDNDNSGNENGDNDNNIDLHDDPSQAPAICAATGSEGVLVAHENCNQFYKCSEGKPSVLSCQNSLLYNPRIPACDWPQNVNCGDRVIPGEDGEGNSSDNDNDNGIDNDNSGNENGDNDNNIDLHDDPSQAPAICAATGSEGVLVAHENCNQFYKCFDGKPTVLNCLNNLLYNPMIQACDWPENVNCGDRVIPEEDSEDDADDNGNDNGSDNDNSGNENGDTDNNIDLHDDPSQAPAICAATESKGVLVAHENCNQFYKCSEGKPSVVSCQNSLLYNPRIPACDWPQNVNCGDRVIPGEDGENNSGDNDNDNGSDNDNSGNENGDNDNNIDLHDDPSQAPVICATTGSEGVLVAHENCNQFYKCFEGKPTVLKCLNNLLYNPMIQACDWPENVNCGDRVIPEEDGEENVSTDAGNNDNGNDIDNHDDPSQAPAICAAKDAEGIKVAHENCNQFYVCSEGKPSALSCPNNLLYDPKTQECDWPQNVNCVDRLIPAEDEEDNANVEADDESENDNTGNDGDGYDYYYSSNAAAICAAPGSDGVLIEHANCHQFYLCSEGNPIVLDCALNQLYNAETKQCDWQENIKCGNRFIPSDDSRSMSIALNKHLVSRKALRH